MSNFLRKNAEKAAALTLGTTLALGITACGGNANATGPDKSPVATSQSGEVPTTPSQSGVETTTPPTTTSETTKTEVPTGGVEVKHDQSLDVLAAMSPDEFYKESLGNRLFYCQTDLLKGLKDNLDYRYEESNKRWDKYVTPSPDNNDQEVLDSWSQLMKYVHGQRKDSDGSYSLDKSLKLLSCAYVSPLNHTGFEFKANELSQLNSFQRITDAYALNVSGPSTTFETTVEGEKTTAREIPFVSEADSSDASTSRVVYVHTDLGGRWVLVNSK